MPEQQNTDGDGAVPRGSSAGGLDAIAPLEGVYLSKADMVTAALREMILTGVLESGSALRQRDIAQRFGVSQTPVREAFRRLEAQGLLLTDTHRGTTIAGGDFGATEANYRIRAALEGLAAQFAAEAISEEEIDEIEGLNEAFAAAASGSPARDRLNREFHFRIYSSAGSPLLGSLLVLLWQAFPARGPQAIRPAEQSIRDHRALIDALRRHDADAAAEITRRHILGAIPYLNP